jgi:hypothetical protein
MNTYNPDQGITVSTTFRDPAGELADPTDVYLDVRRHPDADGTTYTYGTDPEVVRDSEGAYSALLEGPHEAGTWYYGWRGTGAVVGAEQGAYLVRRWRPGGVEVS